MCATTIKIILLSFILYQVSGNQPDKDINDDICKNLCKSCGGVASYVDDKCECYIDNENQKNAECVGRIKRQAEDLHLDFVNCKPATLERLPPCNSRHNYGRLKASDIDLITQYFMNGGPSNGFPIIRSRCDNSGQQFQSTTPVEQLLNDFTNEPLDYYDLSTVSNQIEDPYYEPEQPRTVKPCTPLSYVNRPTSPTAPFYPYVYKCTKCTYPTQPSSSLPIHSSYAAAAATSSMYYPYNQLYSDLIRSNYLPSSQTPCNSYHPSIPYVPKSTPPLPVKNKLMDAIYKSIAEQNYRKSVTNSQSWTDKINSVYHNSLHGGSSSSVIPQFPYNYLPPGSYPIESSIPIDMIQLQTFLAQQNSFLENLNQYLQSYHEKSRFHMHPSYIVGAVHNDMGHSTTTDNTNSWNIESSTPETYRTVTKTSDVQIQQENVSEAVSNAEIKTVNMGNSGLSNERSHTMIPIRRIRKESEIEK
ncbi:uncharacterized protein [Chelonus insularis]|uniref:uncharacterized protein n=1 Tax=Chelonus insularis TaxID=460826 RepID=UPI00158B55FE|nr:uncharacterized protein LOC118065192 [Chelonus insularis]